MLRISGAIPLLPFYAFVAWTGKNLPFFWPKSFLQAVAQVGCFDVRGQRSQLGPPTEIIYFSKSQLGVFIEVLYIRLSDLELLKSWKSLTNKCTFINLKDTLKFTLKYT